MLVLQGSGQAVGSVTWSAGGPACVWLMALNMIEFLSAAGYFVIIMETVGLCGVWVGTIMEYHAETILFLN